MKGDRKSSRSETAQTEEAERVGNGEGAEWSSKRAAHVSPEAIGNVFISKATRGETGSEKRAQEKRQIKVC